MNCLKIVLIASVFTLIFACKKENDKASGGDAKRLTDAVPAEYLKTVTDNGMALYEGNTPPDIQGEFSISPLQFDKNNYSEPGTGTPPGYNIGNVLVKFSAQNDQELEVNFGGSFLPGIEITAPFITGSGNNFTVCFQVEMFGGPDALFVYPFAYLISGTREQNALKNVKMASVGLRGGSNVADYTVEGNVTWYSDKDGHSGKLD